MWYINYSSLPWCRRPYNLYCVCSQGPESHRQLPRAADSSGLVRRPRRNLPQKLRCGDVKPCSINQSVYLEVQWLHISALLCVPPKNVTTFSTITNNKCPIVIILAQSVVSIGVIERWFHFPPHLSSATTLPWEITEHKNDQFCRKQHIVLWINNVKQYYIYT